MRRRKKKKNDFRGELDTRGTMGKEGKRDGGRRKKNNER